MGMIRRTKRSGSFWLCLLLNMILNLEWTIPASIWWFVLALALWVLNILFWMKLMGWAADCSQEKDPPKANKNPYSVKGRSDAPK